MRGKEVVHSSAHTGGRDDWGTPEKCVRLFEKKLGAFHVDAAASQDNAKAPAFFSDALGVDWDLYGADTRVWLNPPYSQNKLFLEKTVEQARLCKHVLVLVPARTDTQWWHRFVVPWASYVWFVEGRMIFSGATSSAPFPSALALFKGEKGRYEPRHIHRDYLCDYPYQKSSKEN